MSETVTEPQPVLPEPVILDPFDFWPSSASRIRGLGGPVTSSDAAYVFHTAYAAIAPGEVRCALRFADLSCEFGSMVVRVNALEPGPGARAESVKLWTVTLRDIVAGGGEMITTFPAVPGKRYAVLGHTYGELDAEATGFVVELTTVGDSKVETKRADAPKSMFGRRMFRRANRMISDKRATLVDPVSQTCTAAQFAEPAYAAWLARLGLPMHRHRRQWESIYILQTLERYGMLKPGARGLGFGGAIEPLSAAMDAMGVSVVANDLTIGDDLTDFDFSWSSRAIEHLGSIEAGVDFVRNSIGCLKMGGLAVHTTELNLTSNDDTIDNQGTVLFRRRDIERLAVDLASRGHLVAQIKYDFDDSQRDAYVDYVEVPPSSDNDQPRRAVGRYMTTSFGIVVRRGDR